MSRMRDSQLSFLKMTTPRFFFGRPASRPRPSLCSKMTVIMSKDMPYAMPVLPSQITTITSNVNECVTISWKSCRSAYAFGLHDLHGERADADNGRFVYVTGGRPVRVYVFNRLVLERQNGGALCAVRDPAQTSASAARHPCSRLRITHGYP